jgi:quercetin dioxygenase-like cupin family protein
MLIERGTGSVHMNLMVNELPPGGKLDSAIHSFEEAYYILSGQVFGMIGEPRYRFGPGDYAISQIGTPHAWHNPGSEPARWVEMFAPQPSATGAGRRVGLGLDTAPTSGEPIAGLGPRAWLVGHFEETELAPYSRGHDGHATNWTSKALVNRALGAQHLEVGVTEIGPGGRSDPAEHPFEQAFFILKGSVVATLEGEQHQLVPGSVAWIGAGGVHSIHNRSDIPARMLVAQAPQAPVQQPSRYIEDWRRLEEAMTKRLRAG